MAYNRFQLQRETGVSPDRLLMLTVAGTSMVPTLYPGDRVMIVTHTDGEPLMDRVIYVFHHALNGVIIKRIRWYKDGTLSLESDNREDPSDFEIGPDEAHEWKVVGRVVRVEKSL